MSPVWFIALGVLWFLLAVLIWALCVAAARAEAEAARESREDRARLRNRVVAEAQRRERRAMRWQVQALRGCDARQQGARQRP